MTPLVDQQYQATLPPRCTEHRNHQAGCPTCKHYARMRIARRSRLQAYGRWKTPARREDLQPITEHLRQLHAAGMSYVELSRISGVAKWTIQQIHDDRLSWVYEFTAKRLLEVQLVPALVAPVGASRRLRALSRAGYRILDLTACYHRHGGGMARRMFGYRRGEDPLPRSSHLAIARMYAELWGTDGPDPRQTVWAGNQGWHPYEAWTDATIDDPDAQPYSDPEAAQYVDWVKVELARLPAGHPRRVPFLSLTLAEQLVLYREHLATSTSRAPRMFISRYRPVPTKLVRLLQESCEREAAGG